MFTDAADMYLSRLEELNEQKGGYAYGHAALDYEARILSQSFDSFLELSYWDKKRIHNLKYYTWVEQQGKTYDEILRQWDPEYWHETFENNLEELDNAIDAFNQMALEDGN